MEQEPLVSVVLPTYNGQKYIRESIDSILGQTYKNWELIIVDDNSNDGTPAIIKEYVDMDQRIRSIRNETNRRISASLNRGFTEAKGEFFTWTSDDNLYLPEAFIVMISRLIEKKDISIVYTKQVLINEIGERIGLKPLEDPERILVGNVINASFMYHRAVHERIDGYDENLFLIEDWDFWLRAWPYFKFEAIDEELYLYRKHSGSLTTERQDEIRLKEIEIMQRSYVNAPVKYSDMLSDEIYKKQIKFGWSDLRNGRRKMAAMWAANALMTIPWRGGSWRLLTHILFDFRI